MREYPADQAVDFAIVGAGCGGSVLASKLAEAGYSVVLFDAGPFWRPLSDFASDEREQEKLYWLDERISGGDDAIEFGANNSGQAVGGSTTHFQMVSLRFRPDWFKSRSRLGYGVDWPVDPGEMWELLRRDRSGADHLRPDHATRGGRRAGATPTARTRSTRPARSWCAGPRRSASTGRRRRSAPFRRRRAKSPPCVYRGMCKIGCSTNAKQSHAGHLRAARARRWGRGARPRHGGADDDRRRWAAGRASPTTAATELAAPEGAACRRLGLLDRDAAAAPELGDSSSIRTGSATTTIRSADT